MPLYTVSYSPLFMLYRLLLTMSRAKKHHDLTRDQRVRILTLREIGWTYVKIREHFLSKGIEITVRQIQHACDAQRAVILDSKL